MADNTAAFLKLLRWCEHYPHEPSDKDYKTMYGGGTLANLDDHPRTPVKKWGKTSTAAGAYQITVATYDEFKKKLELKDFSAASQDKIALALVKQAGGIELINQGKIEEAIKKLNRRWSSLPGGVHSRIKMDEALKKYAEYQKS
jgi:muramidase (phage lysozyme)